MKKPPPLLTPRIIADLRSGDECADPDHPGLRVRTEARRKREAEKLASYTVEKLVEDFVAERLSKQKRTSL